LEHVFIYQAGIYAPDTQLEPNADNISTLLELFKDKGFIPTTHSIAEVSGATLVRKNILSFETPKKNWRVLFESQRVNCIWQKTEKDDTISSDQFITEVSEIIQRITEEFSLKGFRLYFNMRGILRVLSEEELIHVNSKLLNLPLFFKESLPIEWSTRNLSHREIFINEQSEMLNVIMDVNRVKIKFQTPEPSESKDRIEIGLDMSTLQTNINQRFRIADLQPFLNETKTISETILAQIGEMFQ
ncbi:MAG: hypothetical protein HN590_16690, partial [Calditrichaeota bacterium]|nr:hypothetical protein [Calditrichota bacterium]